MPSKKYIELQEFTVEELHSELLETEKQYQKLQFDHALKGLENPIVLKNVRRDIARLNTEIKRRELADADEGMLRKRSKKVARRK